MSGRKNNIKQFNNIAAASMATSLTSSVTDIQFLDNIGLQLTWSGSPVGTFSVQVSANHNQDMNGNVQVAGNWVSLVLTYWDGAAFVTGTTVPTSVGSPIYLDLALLSAPYIQVIYTRSSGTGSLTSTLTAKMV